MTKALAWLVCTASILAFPSVAAAQPVPAASLKGTAPATQGQNASRALLDAVREVVRENPALADSQGDRALLKAVRRVAERQPAIAPDVSRVAKGLKPHLAAQIDAASRLSFTAPQAVTRQAVPMQASPEQARNVLLRNVRAVVQENPALRDGVGDRALVAAVERSAAQHPHMANAIVDEAVKIKPQLSQRITLAATDATAFDGAYATMQGEAPPAWASAPLPMNPQGGRFASDENVPEWAQASLPAANDASFSEASNDIFAMGLEDLMNTKVVTASKSKERAFDVPAAITVITNEDIRRSGQTTVMEALRMVPGMQVSQINSSAWAISARGFADEYANKMLVMIDGRSIYTPTFSGVYWELVNLPLEDIDRIEVIRGPGATVWGANAVNGVINIVTKESKYTQGAYISGGLGDYERAFAEGRVGGEIGKDGHYRFYSRYLDRSSLDSPAGVEQNNGWWRMLTGLRADWSNGGNDDFTVQAEFQHGQNEQESLQFGPSSTDSDSTMSYLRGRWVRALDDGSVLTLSSYIDQHHRESDVLEQRVTTFDVDFNHSLTWMERNNLVWGAGYRLADDSYNSTQVLSFVPNEQQINLFSTFVQNTFEVTEKLELTAGTKLEHNGYTGFEVQPTAKFAYNPDERSTLWGSVARAVRNPSRTEDSIRYTFQTIAGAPPTQVVGIGDSDVESEEMIAYELGYRISPREGLIFDAAAYYNDYDNLTTLTRGAGFFDGTNIIVPLNVLNLGEADIYGVELSSSWQVTPSWLLAGYYSYGKLEANSGSADQLFLDYETLWPEHSFSVRSLYNITDSLEFDTSVYYVSSLDGAREVDGTVTPIDDYIKWDVRFGWYPLDGLELSLVGLNLLESGQQQFVNSRFFPASEIGRSYYGKATWRF